MVFHHRVDGALLLKQATEVPNPDEIPFSFTCKNSPRPWIVFVIFFLTLLTMENNVSKFLLGKDTYPHHSTQY